MEPEGEKYEEIHVLQKNKAVFSGLVASPGN
jgi:hypothetical protein